MKRGILVLLIALLIAGCSLLQEGYVIKETYGENWKFSKGKLLFKAKEEELQYSIAYIGSEQVKPVHLFFEFFISPSENPDTNNINNLEDLHSNINIDMKSQVDKTYSKTGNFKGILLDREKEYDFGYLYLRTSYKVDGIDYEEVLKLPMEEI